MDNYELNMKEGETRTKNKELTYERQNYIIKQIELNIIVIIWKPIRCDNDFWKQEPADSGLFDI